MNLGGHTLYWSDEVFMGYLGDARKNKSLFLYFFKGNIYPEMVI